MSMSDVIQAASTLLVAVAVMASFLQNRRLTASLRQSAYNELMRSHAEFTNRFLRGNDHLLSWYLDSRGYTSSTQGENLRRLYILNKIDIHESNFVNARLLPADVNFAWDNVLQADVSLPEFQELWQQAKVLYAARFVAHVDNIAQAAIAVRPKPTAESPRFYEPMMPERRLADDDPQQAHDVAG